MPVCRCGVLSHPLTIELPRNQGDDVAFSVLNLSRKSSNFSHRGFVATMVCG
jgi:hypothetical protein